MRRIIIIVVIVLALAGTIFYVQNNSSTAPAAPANTSPIVADTAITSEAEVKPLKSAELNVAAGGIIADVLVAEGDSVKKDQVLVRVEAKRQAAAVTQAEAALARAQSAVARSQAALARANAALAQLKAGARPEEVATAQAAVAVAQAELARSQAGADTTALAQAKANMEKAARAVQQAQAAYDRVKDAPFGSIGPDALRLEQTTIDYEAAKTAWEQLVLGPRDVDVNVVKARLVQAQAALAQTQAGARPEAIAAADADVAAAAADTKSFEADTASADAALKQAQIALADTELKAPFDGTVVTLNVNQGETVPLGSFAVRMADLSQWQIETKDLTELVVARIKVGIPADIKFDALPGTKLTGKVKSIGDFGSTNTAKDIVYRAIVALDKSDERLRWNMTASVTFRP
jgi:HlyD family secretion protein